MLASVTSRGELRYLHCGIDRTLDSHLGAPAAIIKTEPRVRTCGTPIGVANRIKVDPIYDEAEAQVNWTQARLQLDAPTKANAAEFRTVEMACTADEWIRQN
jgi:hypothetical protein